MDMHDRRTILRTLRGAAGVLALQPLLHTTRLLAADSYYRAGTGDPQAVFQAAVDEALAAGEIGMQIAVYKNGRQVVDVCGGVAEQGTGRKVTPTTLFNVFSVTKAVTNVALQIQVERGLIDYNKPVAHYWPEFAANGKAKCTVRDALAHRAGIPQMPDGSTPERMADYEWMVKELAAIKPLYEPGTTNAYHSYTWGWLIAEIVRRTDSKKRGFNQFVQDEICKPLGIADLWMGIPDNAEPRVAKMYGQASVRDPNVPSDALFLKTIPENVTTNPAIWELP